MRTLLVLAVFACLTLTFFHDVLLGPNLFLDTNPVHYDPWRTSASDEDLEHKTFRTDSFTAYLPRRVYLSESIAAGRFPLWNPHIFAGMPFFADPQTRVLYPIELLLTRVDPLRAMGYDIAIHVFLAMTGMFLFLRSMGVIRLGALLGGCSYAFSSFFFVRYGHPTLIASAAWIPFFFYGFELARRSERPGTLLLVGFFTMGYLSGFPQIFLFGVGTLVIYALWLSLDHPPTSRLSALKQAVRILGIAGALSALVVSVQMIPFVEFFRESVGLHYEFERLRTIYVAPPILLLRSIFPGLFGNPLEGTDWSNLTRETIHPYHPDFAMYCGVGVLILALVALRRFRESPRLRVLLVMMALSIGLAVSPHLLRLGYAIVPVFRAAKISRISVIACFTLSIMGAMGLTSMTRHRAAIKRHLTVVLICIVGVVLVSSVVFEFVHESVAPDLTEKAESIPEDQLMTIHGYTRSGRIKEWTVDNQPGWVAYERKQIRRGLYFVLLSSILIWLWFGISPHGRRSKTVLGILLVGLLTFDIVSVAKTYYISQAPDSARETPGISALRDMLGPPGRWRIRTARRTPEEMLALPTNTNQIFGIHSLEGTGTMYSRSYANLKKAQTMTEGVIDSRLNRRQGLASGLDDLMSVRFLVAPRDAPRYSSSAVLSGIARAVPAAASLRMVGVGGETRLALQQEPGDSVTFNVYFPSADTLGFAIGFEAERGKSCDSVFFLLRCENESDTVPYRRGFDLSRDGGKWYPGTLDVSSLRGTAGSMTVSLESASTKEEGSVRAGWSRFEFAVRHRPFRAVEDGFEVDLGSRGGALSLELRSEAREVPLEIRFDDGNLSRRWVTFLGGMKSRMVMINLKDRRRGRLTLESDSTFSVKGCRQVWRPWAKEFDCQLVYHTDMCLYENTKAIRKGLCVSAAQVEVDMYDGRPVLSLHSLETVADSACGTCDITSYQPERVVAEVSATADGYLLFQDMYYPGWRAFVDGRETPIFEVDLGIRGIGIPEGSHMVVMAFRPRSFYLGLVLTCVGLVMTMVYALKPRRRQSSSN